MDRELLYRNLVLLSVVLGVPIGLYHRVRSVASGERLDRRQEGLVILIGLRSLGFVMWLVLAAYLVRPGVLAWSRVPLPPALRWTGALIGIAIVPPLLFWVMHTLGTNLTDTVVTRRQHTLVTRGPYRWVRHPFYTVAILWLLALSLMTASALLAVFTALFVLMISLRTPIEEANLISRFGEQYLGYMRQTGRFLPRLRLAR